MILYKARMTPWLLTIATFVAVSAFVFAFSPIKGNILSLLSLFIILIIKLISRGVNIKYLVLCLMILSLASISAIYWQEPRVILIPKYFVLSILIVPMLTERDIRYFVDILSVLLFIVLLCAVFGAIYAYFGGKPILAFHNPDGRLNQLFLTTLTNTQHNNYIRPSGIFDEPGTLSFITCFVAALRHVTKCNKKVTWILLTLGFITTSVAHLIYSMLHMLEELKGHKKAKDILLLVVALISIVAFAALYQPIQDIVSTLLLNRFSEQNIGVLGQDRITAFMNAVGYLNIKSFMFGLNSDCAVGFVNCLSIGYKLYDDNPLTLLISWGVLVALPYYFTLAYLFVSSIRRYSYIMFGVFLLLLQRPYTMNFGYSILIVLTIFIYWTRYTRSRIRKSQTTHMATDALPSA